LRATGAHGGERPPPMDALSGGWGEGRGACDVAWAPDIHGMPPVRWGRPQSGSLPTQTGPERHFPLARALAWGVLPILTPTPPGGTRNSLSGRTATAPATAGSWPARAASAARRSRRRRRTAARSEEHTSELQSRAYLAC